MSATVSPKENSWSVMVHYKPTYIVIITHTHARARTRTDTVHIETRSSPSSVVISMVKLPSHHTNTIEHTSTKTQTATKVLKLLYTPSVCSSEENTALFFKPYYVHN